MNNLVPSQGSEFMLRSTERRLAKFENRVLTNFRRELAVLEAQADLEVARVHAVGYVGKQAMQSVAMVSQLEGQLAELVPLATGRLQAIADMTALASAEIVANSLRKFNS